MKADIEQSFRSMGANLVVVRSGRFHQHGGRSMQMARVTTLTLADADAVRKLGPDVAVAGPAISRQLAVKYGTSSTLTTVEALSPEAVQVRNLAVSQGRLFLKEEFGVRRAVAVVGQTVAKNLFAGENPVGQLITVGRLPVRVIGVGRKLGMDMNGSDQDNMVYIPLDTGMNRVFHVKYIETVYVKGRTEASLATIEKAANELLRKRHKLKEKQENDFSVQNQAAMLEAALDTASSTTQLVGSVGAICLVVAGVGILAVMLMSVRERRGEIGLRRALGARRSDVLLQFLSEAGLLSLSGGLLGLAAGVAGVVLTNHFQWARADFSSEAAGLSFMVSVAVGVLFGIYPAHKASKLDPAVALTAAG
jgi:putative ABC transport system permease protein